MNRLVLLMALPIIGLALNLHAETAPALPKTYAAVAAAEREFAAAGRRDGIQKSFLAHFDDAAIVMRPFATAAPAWYRTHPDQPGTLIWAPQYLAVSGAGDLGLSSGPWRYEGVRDGKPVAAHGHFFSLWKHDAHGWRVLFDHGVGHSAPEAAVENTVLIPIAADAAKSSAAATSKRREAALAAADDALRAALNQSSGSAYATFALPQTLWLREGAAPLRAPAPPATGKSPCGCGPRVGLHVAASGDLGYTIGGAESARVAGVDARVWHYDGGAWKLLAEVVSAVE